MGRTSGDNVHLQALTSGRFVHLTAAGTYTVHGDGEFRGLRVVLNANGGTVTLKNGASEVIGIIAADAAEGTFDYGVFGSEDLIVELGNTCDVTIVFTD